MPKGRPGESRYREKWRTTVPFADYVRMVSSLEETSEQSLLTVLYFTGLRVAEICGDGPRTWRVLTKEGKSFSKQGKLPEDWKAPQYRGKLWEVKERGSLPGIRREDITVEDGIIKIHSDPLKHGRREGESLVELEVRFPNADLIVSQWDETEPGEKVWPFSTSKAWAIVSKASGGRLYPHAFRLSRALRLAQDPGISLADLQGWFGWSRVETANAYLQPVRSTARARKSIERELPR